jgi:hypothetical protein
MPSSSTGCMIRATVHARLSISRHHPPKPAVQSCWLTCGLSWPSTATTTLRLTWRRRCSTGSPFPARGSRCSGARV